MLIFISLDFEITIETKIYEKNKLLRNHKGPTIGSGWVNVIIFTKWMMYS